MSKELIKQMLDNAVHIGHKKQYWSPKMRDYLYGDQNGVHVFDLSKTVSKLEEVKSLLEEASKTGKEILLVGTKVQSKDMIKELAKETGYSYVATKWVPGLLTNFNTLKKRIAKYKKILKDSEMGDLEVLNKKEKSQVMKELERLTKYYEGLIDIKKQPDLIFVVDGHYENLALTEARKLKIPSYAILGSTGDIDSCTNFIPGNVNSIKSIKFLLDYIKPVLKKAKRDGLDDKIRKVAPKNAVKKFTNEGPKRISKIEKKEEIAESIEE